MKKIVNNYLYSLLYQVSSLIIPLFLIPYVFKKLGPVNLGIEAYLLSIMGYFIIFGNMGISTYATRLISKTRNNQSELNIQVYYILFVKLIFTLISLIILIFIIFNSEYYFYFLLLLIYFFASTLFDVNWYYAGLERFKEIVVRNLLTKFLGAILIIMLVNDEGDLWKYLIINGVVLLVPNIYFTIKLLSELGLPKFNEMNVRNMLLKLRPILFFFILSLAIQAYMTIERIIIEFYGGTLELGVYSQILKTLFAIVAPITALGTILLPYFSNKGVNEGLEDIYKRLNLSANAIFILSIGMFFGLQSISREIIILIYGYDYLIYESTFKIGCFIIITTAIYNLVIQQILFPNNLEKIYLYLILIAIPLKFILVFILFPIKGVYGVIIIYIVSEFIILLGSIFAMRNRLDLKSIFGKIDYLKIGGAGYLMYVIINLLNFSIIGSIAIGLIIYPVLLLLFKEKLSIRFFRKNKLYQ